MKAALFLFAFVPAFLAASERPTERESLNREKFRAVWQYPKPSTPAEEYRAGILSRKILSFANLLDEILIRNDSERINIIISPRQKNRFDRQRKTLFLEGGDAFDIKKSLNAVVAGLGLAEDYAGIRDYFGSPVPYRGAFLALFQMNGHFYLSEERNGKSSILLEESQYFNQLQAAGSELAAYRLRNSLWFLNIRRKNNFLYYNADAPGASAAFGGDLFLRAFDSDGKFCAIAVTSGERSHILYGRISGRPEILFADLPYDVDRIYIFGDRIIFSASDESGRALVGVASASQRKIFKLDTLAEKFIVMAKDSNGMLLFYPRSRRIALLDEEHHSVLLTGLEVRKIRDGQGLKYLVAPRKDDFDGKWREALLKSHSPWAAYLKDLNHLNFLSKQLAETDYISFFPLSSDEYVLLNREGSTRIFKKYAVRGLLSEERLIFEKNNRRRKWALAVSSFLMVLILTAQGVINGKKKQKIG